MVDADERAGAVFAALADATRRRVLRSVVEHGPLTATALAAELPISRQAVSKHLAILRDAGLVTVARVGRETRVSAVVAPLAEANRWLEATASAWDARLDKLRQRADR